MEDLSPQSVLRRLLRDAGEAAKSSTVTPARAIRLAMARSAEASVGLSVTVQEVSERVMPLDEALAALDDGLMLITLGQGYEIKGFAAVDLQARTAVVEVQTVGRPRDADASPRKITSADAALCAPMITHFLEDLARTAEDTALGGWADDQRAGDLIPDARSAAMMLQDRMLRIVRMTFGLGGGTRMGTILVALPSQTGPDLMPSPKQPSFADVLQSAVMDAPAELSAVLHRMTLNVAEVEALEVGQMVALSGGSVAGVRLEGPDGDCVAEARLGQVTGLRAVRIERAGAPMMSDGIGIRGKTEDTSIADEMPIEQALIADTAPDFAAEPAMPDAAPEG